MKTDILNKVDITIDAPIKKVWDALTKPEIIKQYFFNTNTKSDWKVGSAITFSGEWEGKTYQDKGTILAFEPPKLLRYDYWSSMSGIQDLSENYVTITFKLSEQNGKTHLTITQDNIPDEKTREHSEANWRMVLENLKKLLEK
jgi:uncharacterized protein YndB with AHSA1/START domain